MAKFYDSMTVSKAVKIVTEALASRGISTDGKDQAIITAAGDFTAYCRSLSDVDKLPSTYYETRTREGNTEYRSYPAFRNLPALSKSVRESMAILGLSMESLSGDTFNFSDIITR